MRHGHAKIIDILGVATFASVFEMEEMRLLFVVYLAAGSLGISQAFAPRSQQGNFVPLRALTKATAERESSTTSRRDVLWNGAGLVGGVSAACSRPEIAIAAMTKSEENPPYAVAVGSYVTPSYDKWRQMLDKSIGPDGNLVFPDELSVVRHIFGKSSNKDGTDTVHFISVFPIIKLKHWVKFFEIWITRGMNIR